MSRRRVRLEEGIYEDAYGLAATVKVAGVQREQRWPPGTDRAILRSWRIQKRAELDADRALTPKPVRGTLRADGDQWILRKQGLACFKADRSHLAAWYPALGDRLRSGITREQVERQITAWRTQDPPVAIRTVRHRVRVLRELYQGLDGAKAKTPVDDVKLQAAPRPEPKPIPVTAIRAVAKQLKAATTRKAKTTGRIVKTAPRLLKHYARFLVRATTGQRPSQIGRAQPGDVDLARRIWFVRSGKDGHPVPLPLNAEMVQAWQLFIKADAWGAFDTSNAAKVLQRRGWPKDIRPYDLRHTLAIDLLLKGADLGDVQGLLGHAQIQTTRSHYAPILTARLKRLTAKRRLKLG